VVLAPERAKRPSDYISVNKEKKQKKADCPFCLDSKVSAYEDRNKDFDQKNTYLIKNKFPAFIEEPELETPKLYKLEDNFYKMKLALGGHDVIVCRDHDTDLPNFSTEIFEDLYHTFRDRLKHYGEVSNVEYAMPIYNHGPQAAASIEHPHAQIFASAIVPNLVNRELTHTGTYYAEHKSCAFCDLIAHEQDQNTRVIFENEEFIAFTFYAARFPFEIWVLPKKHESDFRNISKSEINSLAKISKEIFGRLDETLKDPDLNFYIHSAPLQTGESNSYHYHLEITPRLSVYGGYEIGSGMVIDIVSAEQAAEFLRLSQKN